VAGGFSLRPVAADTSAATDSSNDAAAIMYAACLFLRVRLWYEVIRCTSLRAVPALTRDGGRQSPFDLAAGAGAAVITAKILDPLRMQVTERYWPLRTAISIRWANRVSALNPLRMSTVQVVLPEPFVEDGSSPDRPFRAIRLTAMPCSVPLALGLMRSNSSLPSKDR